MIQRIQTVYLMLVVILSFACLLCDIGSYTYEGEVIATFSNFTFTTFAGFTGYQSQGPWACGILLMVVIFLSMMSIMLYRKRMRQLRLTIISTILLVGYVAVYALFSYFYKENLNLSIQGDTGEVLCQLRFVAVFPMLSIILNVLAIHGIRKDEALVRSLDRLR